MLSLSQNCTPLVLSVFFRFLLPAAYASPSKRGHCSGASTKPLLVLRCCVLGALWDDWATNTRCAAVPSFQTVQAAFNKAVKRYTCFSLSNDDGVNAVQANDWCRKRVFFHVRRETWEAWPTARRSCVLYSRNHSASSSLHEVGGGDLIRAAERYLYFVSLEVTYSTL